MIWQPKPGQRVLVRYRRGIAQAMPMHGEAATVLAAGRGPGPRNVMLDIGGRVAVVPRGNLVGLEDARWTGRKSREGSAGGC